MVFKCRKKGKKVAVLAVLLAVMFMASSAFALYDAPNKRLETYVITNAQTDATGGQAGQDTNVAVTTIIPGTHRILGYCIYSYDTSKNAELFVALYDATSTAGTYDMSTTYLFDEFEASAAQDIAERWYPYPKALTNGLSVRQGDNTVVVIFYEDTRVF